MPLSGPERLIWAVGLFGHLLLLYVVFARGRARSFPFFTSLMMANVVRTVVLYGSRGSEKGYLFTFFITYILDVVLQLCIAYEVARHVFRPDGRWAPDTRRGAIGLLLASLAVALALTYIASPTPPSRAMMLLRKSNFFSSTLLSELFLGMLVLAATVGLPWKTHVARIAYGLGLYSLFDVVLEAGHTMYSGLSGSPMDSALTYIRKVLYLVCLGYWIVTLWREAPAPRELPPQMRERLRLLNARLAYDLYTLRTGRKL